MPKKNRSLALKPEVLPPVGNVLDRRQVEAFVVEAFVEEKILKIMHGPDSLFEPWFRSFKISHEIRRHLTVPEQNKWAYYFARWGCLICGTQDRGHVCLGMCVNCYHRTTYRLKEVLRHAAAEKDGNTLAVRDLGTLARENPDVRHILSAFGQIAEILNGQDPIFEPFFQTRALANEIRRHQTVIEQHKWQFYFAEWGCLVCSTTKRPHQSVGMCTACYLRTTTRLKECLRRAELEKASKGPTVAPRDLGDLAREALTRRPR